MSKFSPIDDVVADLAAGKIVIVTDDTDRENEGDFIAAAEKITPEAINFMAKHGRGLICAPVAEAIANRLQLNSMVSMNQEAFGTAFTVSIDATEGITTGISAQDRARTIQVLANPDSQPNDLVKPGHIFPLEAKAGGVLRRAGHTEASVDLARMAGLEPAGVICEILSDDGTMAELPELMKFAETHELKICTIADLITHRREREQLVEPAGEEEITTSAGKFILRHYKSTIDGQVHFALVKGQISPDQPTLIRVQRESPMEDLFGTPAGNPIQSALSAIDAAGSGALLYMRRSEEFHKAPMHNRGTQSMDLRDYGMGAQILHHLGVRQIRLLTKSSRKVVGLEGHDLEIIEQIALETDSNP